MDRQVDKQIDRYQIDKQIDRQIDRQMDGQVPVPLNRISDGLVEYFLGPNYPSPKLEYDQINL